MAKKKSPKKNIANASACKEWYQNHKAYAIEHAKKRKKQIQGLVLSYLAGKTCSCCGEKAPECIEFHTERKKEVKITRMIHDTFSIDKITKALNKCTILCSNCHRKIHTKAEESK